VTQDKRDGLDRQSLIRQADAQAARDCDAALRSLKKFGQSPAWREVRRSLEAFRDAAERGLIPKVSAEKAKELLTPQDESKATRNARLDERWRRMQAESEEERNARLDEQWLALQDEVAADPTEAPDVRARAAAAAAAFRAGKRPAPIEGEPIAPAKPAHRPPREIPQWPEAMNYLAKERTRPSHEKKTEPVCVRDWLRDHHGVEIVDPKSKKAKAANVPNTIVLCLKQLGRRIDQWFEAHPG